MQDDRTISMEFEDDRLHLSMVVVPAIRGQMTENFRDLITRVEEITGFAIEVVEAVTYRDAIEDLRIGRAQLAWLGVKAYLECAHEAGIEAFAVAMRRKGQRSTYRTLFLVRTDSDIGTLEDARGRRLALSEPGSTSGDLMPRHELTKHGFNADLTRDLEDIIYSGSQESSITSVLSGTCDIAAVSEINYENLMEKGVLREQDLRTIHVSSDIPGPPLVYSTALPEDVRSRIKHAVLNAHKFGRISGYGMEITRYKTHEDAALEFLSTYLRPQWGWPAYMLLGLVVAIIVGIGWHLGIDPLGLFRDSAKYMMDLLQRLLPPDFSDLDQLLLSMVETVEIGILGTVLATVLAVPIGFYSARNVSPHKSVYYVARTVTIFFRAIPEFIMAMILVIAVGFGAMPGVLALGFHTMGFLAKFFAEEMEHVSKGPVEALEATGANRYQIVMFAIVPQIMPSFVGFTLYILDRNIRMATMLGIVGAGGIGYRLQSAFRMFNYQEVSAIIVIIFLTIYVIDHMSSKLRLYVK